MASLFFETTVRAVASSWRPALVGGLLMLSLAGCGNSKGGECSVCTTDDDCASSGLVCVPFSDGSKHCGSGLGATQCRKPLL
jgi:hypothetical protein